jgi:NAD(P)-dependent dehydrogenase (short-subunit alcohol dehydrogenase family)
MAFTNDQFRLDGKVAMVTGAGGHGKNIGRSYALGLAQAGAAVVAADLKVAGAEAVAVEIREAGGRAIAVEVDISSADQVARMADAAKEAFGGVDILVNNAAMMAEIRTNKALDITPDEWNRMFAVNVTGAWNCVRAIVPLMEERGGGKIVSTISAGAYPVQSVYGITKLALVGLTQMLAKELGPKNINVNAIAPGNTLSDAGKAHSPGEDSNFMKFLRQTVALRVQGQPDELVGPLMLLCSSAGDWITGQILNVDGGWVIR